MAPKPNNANQNGYEHNVHVQRLLTDHNGFQRTVSDASFELNKEYSVEGAAQDDDLPPISDSEVENAKCECCGLCEECTQEYIKRVRDTFSGKLICGLCGAAVNEEMEKNGGMQEEALEEHMSACVRFNRIGRSYPVLYQAEAIKEILKKSNSRSRRAMSTSPRDHRKDGQNKGGIAIARSSSCIPAMTREQFGGGTMNNVVP